MKRRRYGKVAAFFSVAERFQPVKSRSSMTREEAIAQIQEACRQISIAMMKVHPAISHLDDAETQSDTIKAAHQLTVELEVIKKKMIRLQNRDGSTEL